MAFTTQQIEALERAIAEGVTSVQYQDKKVTYASIDDMIKALNLMKQQLGLTNKQAGRVYMEHSKGLKE